MSFTRQQLARWIADNERLPLMLRVTLPAGLYLLSKEDVEKFGQVIEMYVDRIVAGDIESVIEEFRASGVLAQMEAVGIAEDFLVGVREDAAELKRIATANARH